MPGPAAASAGRISRFALIAGLAGALLYAGTVANGFVYDDIKIAERNPLARNPGDLAGIFGSHYWAGVHEGGNLYRPLTIWSLALNHAAGGGSAWGYHAANAALHGLVSALVVALASALGLGAPGALAAGLLFATHPVHVEAVAPVVGRSELLAALFVLGGWLLHDAAARGEGARRHLLRAAAALLFGAGILSKENAAVLPALVLAGETLPGRGRGWRAALPTLAAMAAVGAVVLIVRSLVVPGIAPDDPLVAVFGGIHPLTRIMTATGVLGRYLWLLAWPVHLSADYSYHQIPLIESAASPLFLLSAAAHLGLLAAGALLWRRGRLSGLGILVYLIALFPVSNLAMSVGTVMGERLLYLPSVGICLLVPALFDEIAGGRPRPLLRRSAAAALVVVCALYAGRTIARIGDWRDQLTLFTETVRTSPRSAKAWYNLGVARDDAGDTAGAVEAYRRAVGIKPDMAEAHRNLGLDLLAADRASEALPHLREAARLDPGIEDIHGDLGIALHRLGRTAEAERALREEAARRPGRARAWYNLGTILLETGRTAEAVEPLSRAASLDPSDPDVLAQLGMALTAVGRREEALEALEKALEAGGAPGDALQSLAAAAQAAGEDRLAARARALAGKADGGPGGPG